MTRAWARWIASALLATAFAAPAAAANIYTEELRIPMQAAGPRGLEALLVRPADPGRHPLLILSHGSPRKIEEIKKATPWSWYAVAVEFARRGFAVATVMRRGFGTSDGGVAERWASCKTADYLASGQAMVTDLKAAIAALAARPDVDTSRIVAVGQSAGGLATVALTADPPPGLVAAINFAGGRGSMRDFEVCQEERLIAAFGTYGRTSRLPMLWVYTTNDRFFKPELARKFHDAFTAGGGRAEFIDPGPYGKDGHNLFSLNGISRWTPLVDTFLARHNLKPRAEPLPLDLPPLAPPPQLSARSRSSFDLFRRGGRHKAFAVSSDGHFGWRAGRRDIEEAKAGALKLCRDAGATSGGAKDCRIVYIDDAPAP